MTEKSTGKNDAANMTSNIIIIQLLFSITLSQYTFFELRVSATRGHEYSLYKHFNSSTVRCTFPADWVVNTWTKLPHPGVDFNSLTSFKRTLKMSTILSFSFGFNVIVALLLVLLILGFICICHLLDCVLCLLCLLMVRY